MSRYFAFVSDVIYVFFFSITNYNVSCSLGKMSMNFRISLFCFNDSSHSSRLVWHDLVDFIFRRRRYKTKIKCFIDRKTNPGRSGRSLCASGSSTLMEVGTERTLIIHRFFPITRHNMIVFPAWSSDLGS